MDKRRQVSPTNYKQKKIEEKINMDIKKVLIKDRITNNVKTLVDFCIEKMKAKESNILPLDIDGIFKNIFDENDYCVIDDMGNVLFIDGSKYEVCLP